MRFIKLACICLAVVLTGCASGVKYQDMTSSISTVPQGQGRIYFYRDSVIAMAIQPTVLVDDDAVGESKPSGFFYVDINPGKHRVATANEFERELAFTLNAGETKYVKIAPSVGFLTAHMTPELVSQDDALRALPGMSYTGMPVGGK